MRAQSSSNRRFQAELPTGLKSVSTRSSVSDSWWGRNFRASSTMCRYFAESGSAYRRAACSSLTWASSRVKKTPWLPRSAPASRTRARSRPAAGSSVFWLCRRYA